MQFTFKPLSLALITGLSSLLLPSLVNAGADSAPQMHELYQNNCASCHGSDHGGYLAPALNADTLKGRSPTALRTIVMAGSFDTLMPPFYGRLSDDEIRGVIKHLQSTPKLPNPNWTIDDMNASLKVYVNDESKLPTQPNYVIDNMDDVIGVAARGKYGRGEGSKAVFINSKTHQKIGEVATGTAAHIRATPAPDAAMKSHASGQTLPN